MYNNQIEKNILYEDRDILVCRKPSGMPVQAAGIGTMDMESALKNCGGYTFFCFLNNSELNFLNSKPFVISVPYDLLIQIDLLGFSPLQF